METNGSDVRKSWLVAPAVQEKVETRKRAEEQPLQNVRKGSPSRTKNCSGLPQHEFLEGAARPGRHSGMWWNNIHGAVGGLRAESKSEYWGNGCR